MPVYTPTVGVIPVQRTIVTSDSTVGGVNVETAYANPIDYAAGVLAVVGRSIEFTTFLWCNTVNGADTWRVQMHLGNGLLGTVLYDTLAFLPIAGRLLTIQGTIVVRTIGGAGTFDASVVGVNESTGALQNYSVNGGALDTGAANQLVVSATYSTNNAGNSGTRRWFAATLMP